MDPVRSTVRSRDGTVIAFDRVGQGEPVILVGGALTQRTSPQAAGLVPTLAARCTVLNYDRRGRGDSGDTQPYAVEREVEDIDALIREAGGSAYVFGASSGGALALEAAASGLAIAKLALWEPPYSLDESGSHALREMTVRIKAALASGHPDEAVDIFMSDGAGMPDEALASLHDMPFWPGLVSMAHTLPYDMAAMGDGMVPRERAASVTVPTLVMDGEASDAEQRAVVQLLAEIMPNAQRRTLRGQDHAADPQAVAAMVAEFLAG